MNAIDEREVLSQSLFEPAGAPVLRATYIGPPREFPATLHNFRFARCWLQLRAARLRFSGSRFFPKKGARKSPEKVRKKSRKSPGKVHVYFGRIAKSAFQSVCLNDFRWVKKKNELKTATCMLGGEKPGDASGCNIDLDLLLRRRAQNLTFS